jgi:hypothetical protein
VAVRTISSAGALAVALSATGCGVLMQVPSYVRPVLAAAAVAAGGDTVSTEYSPPGIATRAQGVYLTATLERIAATSVLADLPQEGALGVVLVDAMGDDCKLARSVADDLEGYGRSVVRLKPADLARRDRLPPTILWVIPSAGGLASVDGEMMGYEVSVRVVAIETATGKVVLAKKAHWSGNRDRVSDLLGVLK